MPRKTPLVTLSDFEAAASRRVSRPAWAYLSGGGADEITLRRNRECFDAIRLKPRVLVDVSKVETQTEVLGQSLAFPILLAPVAMQRMFHRRGELATAEGAGAAGATLVVSSLATASIEQMGQAARKAGTSLWFQLYAHRDRGFTRDLVGRARAAGCRALCITVDTPVGPARDRERRAGFVLPRGIDFANLRPLYGGKRADPVRAYSEVLDASLSWETIGWIRSISPLPVVLKGILAPEDGARAVAAGVAAVIVSNHGGRNLDTVPATIEALPRVLDAVRGSVPVLMDGGIRRGTDVLKALAHGAAAVLLGRPYLWGLAVNGARGVQQVVEILRTELETAMALSGLTRINQIDRKTLWLE